MADQSAIARADGREAGRQGLVYKSDEELLLSQAIYDAVNLHSDSLRRITKEVAENDDDMVVQVLHRTLSRINHFDIGSVTYDPHNLVGNIRGLYEEANGTQKALLEPLWQAIQAVVEQERASLEERPPSLLLSHLELQLERMQQYKAGKNQGWERGQ